MFRNTLFSPFEQFELSLILPLEVSRNISISITNIIIYLLFVVIVVLSVCFFSTYETKLIPNKWQNFLEMIYQFVLGLIVEQSGQKGKVLFPFIFVTFLFILTSNLIGLTPFGFTVTSHLSVTFYLALSFFLSWIIIGVKNHGLGFLRIFLPSGIPLWLAPLLVVIEILSFLLRPISLSVRLFANMLAGHILLYIIASATLFMGILFFLPFSFILMFMILEIGIAFLQSYVFTILLTIYLKDSYEGGH
jgi:F-type H+-transporting ATPase subunit a